MIVFNCVRERCLTCPNKTYKVDRDAAVHFINAAAAAPSVTRFLLVSYIGSRRRSAPWWPAGSWDKYVAAVNDGVLADYYRAKIVADEALYEASRASSHLVGIGLRPGTLTDEPAGKVTLGRTPEPSGKVSRESVAHVAAKLLATEGVKNSWIDLTDGDVAVDAAVDSVVKEGVDVAEGDPVHKA